MKYNKPVTRCMALHMTQTLCGSIIEGDVKSFSPNTTNKQL